MTQTMAVMKTIYQFSGLDFGEASFFVVSRLPKSLLTRFVLALHLLYICINLKYQFSYQKSRFEFPDFAGNIASASETLFPLLCHFTLIFESFQKRHEEEKINNLMAEIRSRCNLQSKLTSLPLLKFLFLCLINTLIYFVALVLLFRSAGNVEILIKI